MNKSYVLSALDEARTVYAELMHAFQDSGGEVEFNTLMQELKQGGVNPFTSFARSQMPIWQLCEEPFGLEVNWDSPISMVHDRYHKLSFRGNAAPTERFTWTDETHYRGKYLLAYIRTPIDADRLMFKDGVSDGSFYLWNASLAGWRELLAFATQFGKQIQGHTVVAAGSQQRDVRQRNNNDQEAITFPVAKGRQQDVVHIDQITEKRDKKRQWGFCLIRLPKN